MITSYFDGRSKSQFRQDDPSKDGKNREMSVEWKIELVAGSSEDLKPE